MSRYIYTVGTTPALFAPVASSTQLTVKLRQVERQAETAMVCVNDDVRDGDEKEAGLFKDVLGMWMDHRWPIPGDWERRPSEGLEDDDVDSAEDTVI